MCETVFKFYNIGKIVQTINGKNYTFFVDVCDHGARIKTSAVRTVEVLDGIIEKVKTIYCGEGDWLALPSLEIVVLDILNGTEEEAEQLVNKYDDLLAGSLPELITGNCATGFVLKEVARLKEKSDLPS